MKIHETGIPDLIVIEPTVFGDDRGYFLETYREKVFLERGIENHFIQENESCSVANVIRGLHFQLAPYAQAKLVRAVVGKIWDVAVDLRHNSPTFKKWYAAELSENNKKQMFIPRGFAHGFAVLSEKAIVCYKTDNYYHPPSESGIRFDDLSLAIEWPVDIAKAIISNKDRILPEFEQAAMNFDFGLK